jgi:chromosome segregation ATPase
MWPFSTIRRLKADLQYARLHVEAADRVIDDLRMTRDSALKSLQKANAKAEDLEIKRNLLTDLVRHRDGEIERLKSELAVIRVRRDPKTGRLTRAEDDV